jgi:hypothetical protein
LSGKLGRSVKNYVTVIVVGYIDLQMSDGDMFSPSSQNISVLREFFKQALIHVISDIMREMRRGNLFHKLLSKYDWGNYMQNHHI